MSRILIISAALLALAASMPAQDMSAGTGTIIASNKSTLDAQRTVNTPQFPVELYRMKNDVLGESIAQYQRNNSASGLSASAAPKDCTLENGFGASNSDGTVECTSFNANDAATYAGVTYRWKTVRFSNGRLHDITIVAHHNGYESLKNSLTEKFGPPARIEKAAIGGGIGRRFESTNLYWNNGTSTIAVIEYYGDNATTLVQFTLADAESQAQTARE